MLVWSSGSSGEASSLPLSLPRLVPDWTLAWMSRSRMADDRSVSVHGSRGHRVRVPPLPAGTMLLCRVTLAAMLGLHRLLMPALLWLCDQVTSELVDEDRALHRRSQVRRSLRPCINGCVCSGAASVDGSVDCGHVCARRQARYALALPLSPCPLRRLLPISLSVLHCEQARVLRRSWAGSSCTCSRPSPLPPQQPRSRRAL